jgi:ABC-type transport system involved in cytochrome c biogenesis permease subunit
MNGDLSKLSDADLANLIDQKSAALQGAQPWSSELVKFLTLSVLTFGVLVILVMAVLVLKKSSTGEILRLFTVPMVIVAAVFLVVTGFSNDQITPVIGLLGTLAGYILGVQSQKGTNPPPP